MMTTNMFNGIPNLGYTCYANAILQCLRRSLVAYTYERIMLEQYITGEHSILPYVSNTPSDAHELYCILMDQVLPKDISRLFLWSSYGHSIAHVDEPDEIPPPIICVYKDVKEISILLWSQLDMPPIYHLVACVCYASEHYYALLRNGRSGEWYIANDSMISVCNTSKHPVCMLFYTR